MPKLEATAYHEAGHFVGYCILGGAIPQSIEVASSEESVFSGRVTTLPGARAFLDRGGITEERRKGEAFGVCRVYAAGKVAEERAAQNEWDKMQAEIGWLRDREGMADALRKYALPAVGRPPNDADALIRQVVQHTRELFSDPVVWEAVELVKENVLRADGHKIEGAACAELVDKVTAMVEARDAK